MNLAEINILDLLPQRPPFVMIDHLIGYTDDSTVTDFVVTPHNIFIDPDGSLRPEALIENMAQTCAARLGYYYKYILQLPVRIGVIGAVRHCRFLLPVKVGDLLTTTITVTEEVFGMTLIDAKVERGEELVAMTEMKLALAPEK